LLEEKAKDGTASSIRELMGMAPKTAHVVNGDSIEEVPISTIGKGDILEVRPGEKVPVDGEVIYAESFMTADAAYVDESMITGEPTPAEKKKGSTVLAGTIPSQGKFRMRARQIGEDTALAHIIRMVQEAQNSKHDCKTGHHQSHQEVRILFFEPRSHFLQGYVSSSRKNPRHCAFCMPLLPLMNTAKIIYC